MTDIATLGIKVDSTGTVKAASDLRALGTQAGRTEQQVARAGSGTSSALGGVSTASAGAARSFSTLAASSRPVLLQLSQVAQQGQATGNYLQALAIQGADIGMVFGTVGIVAGVAAGALLPLIGNMLRTSDGAEELEDAMDALSSAMRRLDEANSRAGGGLDELGSKYGDMASKARELFEVERQMASIRASSALDAATRGIAGQLGVGGALDLDPERIRDAGAYVKALTMEVDRLSQQTMASDEAFLANNRRIVEMREEISKIRTVSKNLDELADILGVTEDEAREVAARFTEIGAADGARAQADAMIDLVAYIREASDNLSDAEEEGQALYDQLLLAAMEALNLAQTDMATPIGAAADEALRLASALSQANLLMAQRPGLAATLSDEDLAMSQDVIPGAGGRERQRAAIENFVKLTTPKAGGRKSGGRKSGGVSDAEREAERLHNERLREAESLTRKLETATERYNRELADLKELYDMGYLSAEQFARGQEMLNEELNADKIQAAQDGVAGFVDALFEGEDALKSWARTALVEIAKVIAQLAILKALGLPTGGVSLGGTVLGGFAGLFDSGGNIPAGQWGIAGENGPEIVRGPAHVTSTADTAKAMGGHVTVSVDVDQSGNLMPFVRTVSGNVAAQTTAAGLQASSRALPGRMQSANARGV